jgi:hypothetical protein
MVEQMQTWVQLYGPEQFEGESEYLLAARKPEAQDGAHAFLWQSARYGMDASLIQGKMVQRWGHAQRLLHQHEDQRMPDLSRPFAVLEPTTASVPQHLRCDPRSRDALVAMWEALEAELEPVRLKFCLGQRSFELLCRIQNRFTSLAQYHLEHDLGTQATLQPAQAEIYVSPQARSAQLVQAHWRRRSANAKPAERLERLPLPATIGVYCHRTTRRLYSSRLRAAKITIRQHAVIRLSDHSDQVLAILIHVQAGHSYFADIVQYLDLEEQCLGNVLLDLFLSGIVDLELSSAITTVFSRSHQSPRKPKKVHALTVGCIRYWGKPYIPKPKLT